MTTVHFDLGKPDPTDTTTPVTSGTILCVPTARHTAENTVVLPIPFAVPLDDNGQATAELTASGPDWAWTIVEHTDRGGRRTVVVPDTDATVEYVNLADVDPATLDPATPVVPAYQSLIDAATAAATDAQTDATTALTTKADKPGVAAVAPLRAYGSSALIDTAATQLVGYFNRARRRLGTAVWANYAVGGSMAADACAIAYGTTTSLRQGTAATYAEATTGPSTWTPTTFAGGTVVLDAIGNDLLRDGTTTAGGTTTKSRAGATHALEALTRLVRAGTVRQENDATITTTGTWTPQSAPGLSGGAGRYTLAPGATMTFPARNGDTLILLGWDASAAGATGATYTLTADGTTYKTGTTNNQTRRTPTGTGAAPLPIHVEGLPAGDHTMVLTHTGSTGQFLYVDCILRESPTPPTVVLMKFAGATAAGYATFPGASAALVPVYDAIVDAVAAKFPDDGSVIVLDPKAGGYDPAAHAGPDGIHATDVGADLIADLVVDTINSLLARPGLIRA